ncbi:hypothetical protein D9619_003968 [Psilocybe cf. subviscida]|uniref:HNH nuclease domain-containing protein n=1 Tax=Psilocybe cf. subviscida TaxID=2480587 RepID=A0A8H5F7I6_9AGAR|nr:hypothetical protein D9619_003968 [Psilocybe cf. subviscida]
MSDDGNSQYSFEDSPPNNMIIAHHMHDDENSQYSFEDSPLNNKIITDQLHDDDRTPYIPPLVKWQAEVLDPNDGRCLITNASPQSGVTYIHCLPLRIRENRKWTGRMEWYWGLRWDELDLRSPHNVFAVSCSLGSIFDFPKMLPAWILLPEDHIVDAFYDSLTKLDKEEKPCEDEDKIFAFFVSRGRLPELKTTTFKYHLFPLPQRMQSMILTHQANPNTDPDLSAPPKPSDFSVHLHPFNTLPWAESHLDPKFVIMEAGRKLMLVPPYEMLKEEWFTSRPALQKILMIFEAWRAPIPSVAFSGRCPDYYTPEMGCPPRTVDDITECHGRSPYYSYTVDSKREKEAKKYARSKGYSNSNSQQVPPKQERDNWTAGKVVTWSQDVSAQTAISDAQSLRDDDVDAGTDGSRTPPRRLVFRNGIWC